MDVVLAKPSNIFFFLRKKLLKDIWKFYRYNHSLVVKNTNLFSNMFYDLWVKVS